MERGHRIATTKFFRRDLHAGLVRNMRKVDVLTNRRRSASRSPRREPPGAQALAPWDQGEFLFQRRNRPDLSDNPQRNQSFAL